jgi:hypothetical protein
MVDLRDFKKSKQFWLKITSKCASEGVPEFRKSFFEGHFLPMERNDTGFQERNSCKVAESALRPNPTQDLRSVPSQKDF